MRLLLIFQILFFFFLYSSSLRFVTWGIMAHNQPLKVVLLAVLERLHALLGNLNVHLVASHYGCEYSVPLTDANKSSRNKVCKDSETGTGGTK